MKGTANCHCRLHAPWPQYRMALGPVTHHGLIGALKSGLRGPEAPAGYRGWPRPSLSPSLPSWRGLRCTSFRRWRARLPPTELVGPLAWPDWMALLRRSPLWCRSGAASGSERGGLRAQVIELPSDGPLIEDALGNLAPFLRVSLVVTPDATWAIGSGGSFLRALLPRCSAAT